MLKGSSGSLVNLKTSTAWKYPLQVVRHRTWMGYVPSARQRGDSWVLRLPRRGRARDRGRDPTWVQQQGLALRHPLLVREGELPRFPAWLAPPQRHSLCPAVLHQDGDRPGLTGHHREADVPVALVVLRDDVHPVLRTDELSPAGREGSGFPSWGGGPRGRPGEVWAGCCRSYHFLARLRGTCVVELGCWFEPGADTTTPAFVLGLRYWSATTIRFFTCKEQPASVWPQGPVGDSYGASPGWCKSRYPSPGHPSPS